MSQLWSAVLTYVTANWTELLGSLTGILCVWLLIKQNIWNWPIGIANNIFYVFVFFKSGLYADMGLSLGLLPKPCLVIAGLRRRQPQFSIGCCAALPQALFPSRTVSQHRCF